MKKYSSNKVMLYSMFLCLLINGCTQPKEVPPEKPVKEWMKGPEREEIETGIFYGRFNYAEEQFNKYDMDPREIGIKEVLPYIKELKGYIETKNFKMLVENTSRRILNPLGEKLGHLNANEHEEKIINLWLKSYHGKDKYCDYHELFLEPITKIEFFPYSTNKPDDFGDKRIEYRIFYTVRLYHSKREPDIFLMDLSFYSNDDGGLKQIDNYIGHCPIPNLVDEH